MPTADLTVVMANYNHARYLPRALDAVLTQSVRPREVVVLDDASTKDNSVEVLEGYARRDPAVRFVRNERNLGVLRSYNKGAGLATSAYVALVAADDYLLPGFVEKLMAQLDRHPRAGACFAYDSYAVGEGGPVEANPSGWPGAPGYFTPDEVCTHLRHGLPGHAIICRADALADAGGYLLDLEWYADWFAFLVVAFRHGVCHVPETLAVRVLLPGAYSAAAKEGENNARVLGAVLDRLRSPRYADVTPHLRRNGAMTYFGPDLVRAAARRADRWDPAVLGLLNGFSMDQYEALLADPDPAVREVAGFFLGPFWRQNAEKRAQRENEIIHLRNLLIQAREQAPPAGAAAKLRWLAGKVKRKLAG